MNKPMGMAIIKTCFKVIFEARSLIVSLMVSFTVSLTVSLIASFMVSFTLYLTVSRMVILRASTTDELNS